MFGRLVSNQINQHFTLWESLRCASWILRRTPQFSVDFSPYFNTHHYVLGSRARDLLFEAVNIIQPDKTKKIGVPAFICGVAALPFIAAGYEIEWLDTDENGVISVDEFRNKVSGLSAVLVPHVFGQPAPLKEIYQIAKAQPHDVLVIEDAAHLWRKIESDKYFDLKLLSFGREKVVSCVSGGALIWPEKSLWSKALKTLQLPEPPQKWVNQHLIQPLFYSLALPWWHWGGKVLPMLGLKFGILPMAVTREERFAEWSSQSYGLSRKLQRVLQFQCEVFFAQQIRRKKMSAAWKEGLVSVLPRSKILLPASHFRVIIKDLANASKRKIKQNRFWHLAEWDGHPIGPQTVDLDSYGYRLGSCLKAEKFAQNHFTLPTHRRLKVKDIKRFLVLLEKV